jgi:hypothetical protein
MATIEKQLFCHSHKKAVSKYVDEIDARVDHTCTPRDILTPEALKFMAHHFVTFPE